MEDLYDQLMRTMSRFRRLPMRMHDAIGLPPAEFHTLKRMQDFTEHGDCCDESPVNVSDLHDRERMSMPAVSQALGALERRGYVTRSISEQDRRKITVHLTPEGERFLVDTDRHMHETMDKVIARFGEDNMRTYLQLTEKLLTIMERTQPDMDGNVSNHPAKEGKQG